MNEQQSVSKIGPDEILDFGVPNGGTYKLFLTDKSVRGTIIQHLGYDNQDGSAYGKRKVGDMVRYLNGIGFNVISFKYPEVLNFIESARLLGKLITYIHNHQKLNSAKVVVEGYSFGAFFTLNTVLQMNNEDKKRLFETVTHFRVQPLITGRGDFSFGKLLWHADNMIPIVNMYRIHSDILDWFKVKFKAYRSRRKNGKGKSIIEIIREGSAEDQLDFSTFIEYFRLSKPQSERVRSMYVDESIISDQLQKVKNLTKGNSFMLITSTRDFLMNKKSTFRNFTNLEQVGFKPRILFIENIKKEGDREAKLNKVLSRLDKKLTKNDWSIAYTNRSWDGHIGLNLESDFHELLNDVEENGKPTRDWLIDKSL